jgi:HK97 family phage major capsid protein
MAITAATTLGSNFSGFLSREQSAPIFNLAYQSSVVQQLAPQVPLGIAGQSIPVVTGKVSAGWVAEGAQKPASSGSMTLKTMDPKKLAAIVVVSAEVVRANPGGYMDVLRPQVGEAFAVAFDAAALHGTSSPFSTNLDTGSSTQEFTGTAPAFTAVYDDLNAGLSTLINAGKKPNGWAFDSRMEPVFNGAKDTAARPLFLDATYTEQAGLIRAGSLLGRRAFIGDGVFATTPKIYGYLGDWTQTAWGTVGGISYDVSTETSVTINGALVSLWENNLVAIRAEAEYGWLVNDAAAFVKFTNAT